jgi:hypothetical protein
MIRIITIEREYGCGAAGIARELAARLGWKLWDQLLTQEIARFMQCDWSEVKRHEERMDPLYYRLLRSFTLGSYEGNSSVYPVETWMLMPLLRSLSGSSRKLPQAATA